MIEARAIDIAVVIAYFIGITLLGVYFGRFTRSTKDFFFAGQRFPWWMIAMSCIATVVGSYSFIKYSEAGYKYGLSSTMTYLNDWFIVPFFLLGWMPIIYFNRIVSIPEYFGRRFDGKTRLAATVIIMIYMIGYVGINFYTLGVALQPILKINIYLLVTIIAVLGAIYLHAGGQTSVIMTDIVQGFILLAAGFILFFLGVHHLGGWEKFWNGLSTVQKLPFAGFNSDPSFNSAGIFWQDAFASSIAFWFMSQGTIMRFMSARSPRDGTKAMFTVLLILMPLAAIALSNAGWVGRAMQSQGQLPENVPAKNIFVVVAYAVSQPGVFGFVLAALTAALMSTIDTLINAISAIFVYDIYRPYFRPEAEDRVYLKAARISALVAAGLGILLVPVFSGFSSIYLAHGVFIATVTPAMALVILLSIFWKKFSSNAAFATLLCGSGAMVAASFFPVLVTPIAHGIPADKGYLFIRALFGLLASGFFAVVFHFIFPRSVPTGSGLVFAEMREAIHGYKGGEANDAEYASPLRLAARIVNQSGVGISPRSAAALHVRNGDIIHVSRRGLLAGAFQAFHDKVRIHGRDDDSAEIPGAEAEIHGMKDGELLRIEKII